jgi:hypothetical protein
VPDQKTAPPTTETQDGAREAAERLVSGQYEAPAAERAQMQVARANQELVRRGDWTLPARHAIDRAQLEVLQATVAKGLTPAEMAMFLEVSSRYGLDPFLKHVFAAKFDGASGGVTIFTGRDGLLHAARVTGRFVRMISAVVRANDAFEVETVLGQEELPGLPSGDPSEGAVFGKVTRLVHRRSGMGTGEQITDGNGQVTGWRGRGPIIGAWALVWKAGDPEPYYAEAPWEEHGALRQADGNGKPTTWTVGHRKGFPEQMMRKVAESIALRMTFGITGIVGAEELGDTPERVQNLSEAGGASGVARAELVVQWGEDDLGAELRALVDAVNELRPGSWRPAKVAMRINGQPDKRAELRDTLRRTLGNIGEQGKAKLEAIPFTRVDPPDVELVDDQPEPMRPVDDPEALRRAGGQVTPDAPSGLEGTQEPRDAPETRPEGDGDPGPGTVEGSAEELPAYDQSEHSSLVDSITELRGVLEGMEGDEPTLELEETRGEAQAELGQLLEALELMNQAAEAVGARRVDA